MKEKLGPLPRWAWVLIAGGTIGGVLLWKRAKAKEAAEQGEPIPEHLAAGLPEVGGGGGAGGGESADAQLRQELGEAKGRLEGAGSLGSTSPSSTTATPVSDFLTTEHELREGGWQRAGEAKPAGATGSTAGNTSKALTASKGGQAGRGGVKFKPGTFHGLAAHIYARAVPGGVGPGRNIIVLNPSHAEKHPHSKTPNHAHAKAKPHSHASKPRTHSKPARPTVHRSRVNVRAKRRF